MTTDPDDGYTIALRKNETGEVRECEYPYEWSEFWWTDGNYGCDCNREWEFQRAGGEELTEDPQCSHTKYTVVHVILKDGTKIDGPL